MRNPRHTHVKKMFCDWKFCNDRSFSLYYTMIPKVDTEISYIMYNSVKCSIHNFRMHWQNIFSVLLGMKINIHIANIVTEIKTSKSSSRK